MLLLRRLSHARLTHTLTRPSLVVTPHKGGVVEVALNRAHKLNALSALLFSSIHAAFEGLGGDASVRAIVLTGGASRSFCSGIDLGELAPLLGETVAGADVARRGLRLRRAIEVMRDALTAVERVRVPVVAAVAGHCDGAGVDLICAADIRLASEDASFCVKEVELGIAADLGTLQRLPLLGVSDSFVREICFTARRVGAGEALARGLVSSVHADAAAVREAALSLAARIASLSPVAVQGTKAQLSAHRAGVAQGLAAAAQANALLLQSDDVRTAMLAALPKSVDAQQYQDV
jgi:enoyl-CoA hydratase/carnithine racemase